MKNKKDIKIVPEADVYFERLEKASPKQASSSIIAQILLKLKKGKLS